jgi:hypothetical protein
MEKINTKTMCKETCIKTLKKWKAISHKSQITKNVLESQIMKSDLKTHNLGLYPKH